MVHVPLLYRLSWKASVCILRIRVNRPSYLIFFSMVALQVPHTAAQGSEEIFECNGDDEEQRILNEEKTVDRMLNFRESVRAKTDSQSEMFGMISSQTLSPSEAFEVFQGIQNHVTLKLNQTFRDVPTKLVFLVRHCILQEKYFLLGLSM